MVKQLIVAALLCAPTVAHCQALPPIPDSVETQIGWVPVKRAPLVCGTENALGCFHVAQRVIWVRDSLSRIVEWKVVYHEIAHLRMFDARIQFPDEGLSERVADLFATLWLHDMLARKP